ncbi:MAG: ORF6N domain-containing protein [Verrucomicrobiota bacterium]
MTSPSADLVESLIRLIRGQRVILDADLAQVYGVPTKRLNEAVRRNAEKFPEDFAFTVDFQEVANMRSQIATASKRNIRYRPWVFTEHGAIMAANVLNSPRAVQMSVFVVRAFVKMRETFAQNKELAAKLAELERNLTDRLDDQEQAIVHILGEIKKLMEPVPADAESASREIGFHIKEEPPVYAPKPRKKKIA